MHEIGKRGTDKGWGARAGYAAEGAGDFSARANTCFPFSKSPPNKTRSMCDELTSAHRPLALLRQVALLMRNFLRTCLEMKNW